jgi:uncharacterized membrane protein (UPF0127 family)
MSDIIQEKGGSLLSLLGDNTAGLVLAVAGRPAPLASTIEPAFDSATRKRGLLGRDGLEAGYALVIAPCQGVHTFGMRFPIDVIFAARDGRIHTVRREVAPRRIALSLRAFAAIEMAAGSAARAALVVGDVLEVRSPIAETASSR